MIRKTIHYCWFGGNPLPELVKKCMESWKKFCPEYEIKEWNETNFNINCCQYVKEAYEAQKWAFVSDYCRFWVLYNYGGIYLDTDVELIKPIDTLPTTFVGFENESICNSGLIRGAQPNDEICKLMLDSYHSDKFVLDEGHYNTKTVCIRETEILKRFGLQLNGKMQQVCNTIVYPAEYFSPKNYITQKMNITDNTISIHHYDASWYSEEDKLAIKLRVKFSKFMPKKFALRYAKFIAVKRIRGLKFALKETLHYLIR